MKYTIEDDGFFVEPDVKQYAVKCDGEWPVCVAYDINTHQANCCNCSGPLSAMLSTCRHAKAVKRFADKIYKP